MLALLPPPCYWSPAMCCATYGAPIYPSGPDSVLLRLLFTYGPQFAAYVVWAWAAGVVFVSLALLVVLLFERRRRVVRPS